MIVLCNLMARSLSRMLRVLPFIAALAIYAQEIGYGPWQKVDSIGTASVYNRTVPSSSIVSFKLETNDTVSIAPLAATLLAVDQYSSWMANVAESRIVRHSSHDDFRVYQRFRFAWPFVDRDIVVEVHVVRNYRKGVIHAEIHAVNDPSIPVTKGGIRMTTMTGSIMARYRSMQSTDIVYSETFDPGGNFMGFLATMVSRKMPLRVMRNLKRAAKRPGADRSTEAVNIARAIEDALAGNELTR